MTGRTGAAVNHRGLGMRRDEGRRQVGALGKLPRPLRALDADPGSAFRAVSIELHVRDSPDNEISFVAMDRLPQAMRTLRADRRPRLEGAISWVGGQLTQTAPTLKFALWGLVLRRQRSQPRRKPPDRMDRRHSPRHASVRDEHGRTVPRARQGGRCCGAGAQRPDRGRGSRPRALTCASRFVPFTVCERNGAPLAGGTHRPGPGGIRVNLAQAAGRSDE
jgi:hypothetical protein